jgi:hypothetical protein
MEAKAKVWHIKVDCSSYTTTIREGDSADPYDGDDTSTDHTINGIHLVDDDGYRVISVNFEPIKGQTYFLLYAIYSTGDSFSRHDGQELELIGIYDDKNVAIENEQILRNIDTENYNVTPVELHTEGLGVHKYVAPWAGYFESLDALEVQGFTLE